MKHLIIIVIISLACMCFGTKVFAQTYIERNLNTYALNFQDNGMYGIKRIEGSTGKVKVSVFMKKDYAPGDDGKSKSFIYGFTSDTNTNNGTFENKSFSIDTRNSWFCQFPTFHFPETCIQNVHDQSSNNLELFRRAVLSKAKHNTKAPFMSFLENFHGRQSGFILRLSEDGFPTVIIEIQLIDNASFADIQSIKIPGVAEYTGWSEKLVELRHIFEHPQSYPNYVMLAAHRGYWMHAPENSLEAFKKGVDAGADMIEIDVKMTKDEKIMVAHDFHLGRLTNIPEKLKNSVFQKNGAGKYLFSKMKFCDLRPDLCPDIPGSGYDPKAPNNCNDCTATPGVNNIAPVKLIRPNGQPAENIPTLGEAFYLLKKYPVLIDIDKIDPGDKPKQAKTYFFDAIYTLAEQKEVLGQIIVKQRIDKFSAEDLRASTVVDWSQWYFTPTAFSDSNIGKFNSLKDCLNSYFDNEGISDKKNQINSPGVEYVYLEKYESAFEETYKFIRGKNKRVFQFPQYPENYFGVWNPKKFVFTDIDPAFDRRNDWNWLLQKERRPDVIITDRFEVFLEILNKMELRNKDLKK